MTKESIINNAIIKLVDFCHNRNDCYNHCNPLNRNYCPFFEPSEKSGIRGRCTVNMAWLEDYVRYELRGGLIQGNGNIAQKE